MSDEDKNKLDMPTVIEACEAHAEAESYWQKYESVPSESESSNRYFSLSWKAKDMAREKMTEADPQLRAAFQAAGTKLNSGVRQGDLEKIRDAGDMIDDVTNKAEESLKRLCKFSVS